MKWQIYSEFVVKTPRRCSYMLSSYYGYCLLSFVIYCFIRFTLTFASDHRSVHMHGSTEA